MSSLTAEAGLALPTIILLPRHVLRGHSPAKRSCPAPRRTAHPASFIHATANSGVKLERLEKQLQDQAQRLEELTVRSEVLNDVFDYCDENASAVSIPGFKASKLDGNNQNFADLGLELPPYNGCFLLYGCTAMRPPPPVPPLFDCS